ncbi:MAG TPA: hypothetical protein VND65_21240 [Candidatus Binatia bacterium]|nr:hypothetical protein [Candidatus Binatia bacterium]
MATIKRRRPRRNSDEEECMKKIGLLSLVILVTILLTLAFSAAASPKSAVVPVVAAAPALAAAPAMPPHPRVHESIEAMRNAREHLEHAEGEFHGHRRKAIEHLDAAIHEAEICEQEP